jgi:hypothetical protein
MGVAIFLVWFGYHGYMNITESDLTLSSSLALSAVKT